MKMMFPYVSPSLDLMFFEAGLCTFPAVSLECNVEAAAQNGN